MLLAFAVPYGLGAGAIDAALNNYVALHYKARHMSWLHCFWGVGTIVSPFVMSWALTHRTWNDGYRAVALVQLCIAVLLLVTLPVWKSRRHRAGGKAAERRRVRRAENKGRAVSSRGLFFRLLRRGSHGDAVGKHVFCRGQAGFPRRTPRGWLRSFISASPRGGS